MSQEQALIEVLEAIQHFDHPRESFRQIAEGIRRAIQASTCWCLTFNQHKAEIIAASSAVDRAKSTGPLPMRSGRRRPEILGEESIKSSVLLTEIWEPTTERDFLSTDLSRLFASVGTHENQEVGILAIRSADRPFRAFERALFAILVQLITFWLAVQRSHCEQEEARQFADDIASIVGHELRTPLAGAMGYLQLAGRWLAYNQTEPAGKAVNAALELSRALERELEDLLESSRLSHGRVGLQRISFDLVELVESVANSARVAVPDHGISLQAPPSLMVYGDPLRLRRVFENLVANALKFSPPGTNVRLDIRVQKEFALVIVSDEGPGIAHEHLRRIFDRFYQVSDPTRRPRGLGLGLTLAQQIVNAHGGRIWCTSQLGRGSKFHVLVPLGPRPGDLPESYSPPE